MNEKKILIQTKNILNIIVNISINNTKLCNNNMF